MILKDRIESIELIKFRSLNTRMNLSSKDKKYYLNLEKGYKGEMMFDSLTANLQNDLFILNDLCLEHNNSIFQIDTLIISQETIYQYEVKNYEGDYYYNSEAFYSNATKEEIKNPLDQLKRSKLLLRLLLKNLGIYLPIEGAVTFVNPEFTLYQAPLNVPIIYPTQLNKTMKKLNEIPSNLNVHHRKLAEQLISLHFSESPYSRYPPYTYEQIKKGVICPRCNSFMLSTGEKKLVCSKCDYKEDVDSSGIRTVNELKHLFPNIKITTAIVHDWCVGISSQKTIRWILLKNFKAIGERRLRYFE